MEYTYDVCVFGGCALDLTFYADKNGNYNDEADVISPGGKGSNQAVAAARAGAKTVIISKLGNDNIGKTIIDNLVRNNIDVSFVEMVDNLDNDAAYVYINEKNKDNDIKRVVGAADSFTPEMVNKYEEVLLNSKIVLGQMKIPKDVSIKLINFCYSNNIPIVITPCRPKKLCISDESNIDLIDKITYITCNYEEFIQMFNTDDVEKVISKYPNKLIVTLGPDGLIYNNGTRNVHLPAPQKDVVVDTTGAGDTFAGNFAALIAKGINFEEAVCKAQYASGIKIMSETAQFGMPYIDELDKYYSKHKKIL